MTELEQARTRFKAISEGHYAPKQLSIDEAKKQLRAADPSIDISDILKALHQETDLQTAATATLVDTLADPKIISYWSPALIGLFQAIMKTISPAADPRTDTEDNT